MTDSGFAGLIALQSVFFLFFLLCLKEIQLGRLLRAREGDGGGRRRQNTEHRAHKKKSAQHTTHNTQHRAQKTEHTTQKIRYILQITDLKTQNTEDRRLFQYCPLGQVYFPVGSVL